jgi:hypothetical protein
MVWCKGPTPLFACEYLMAWAPFIEKTLLSPLNDLGTPAENQLTIVYWLKFTSGPFYILLVAMLIFILVPQFWLMKLCRKFWD